MPPSLSFVSFFFYCFALRRLGLLFSPIVLVTQTWRNTATRSLATDVSVNLTFGDSHRRCRGAASTRVHGAGLECVGTTYKEKSEKALTFPGTLPARVLSASGNRRRRCDGQQAFRCLFNVKSRNRTPLESGALSDIKHSRAKRVARLHFRAS